MIELINIQKSYPTQTLYQDLNLRLNKGDKVGLVGRNGTGKSTLFKLILGEEQPDSGDIATPKNYKIGALKQYFDFKEKTLLDETATALSEDDKYNIYKAEKILFGLGFSEEDLQKEPKSFSPLHFLIFDTTVVTAANIIINIMIITSTTLHFRYQIMRIFH